MGVGHMRNTLRIKAVSRDVKSSHGIAEVVINGKTYTAIKQGSGLWSFPLRSELDQETSKVIDSKLDAELAKWDLLRECEIIIAGGEDNL
jgi:hypothetical protein